MRNTEQTQNITRNRHGNFNWLYFLLLATSYFLLPALTGCATIPKEPPKPKVYLEVSKKEYKPEAKELVVTFIDVGQGDSIFIKTPNGKNVLIDSGGTPYWKQSEYDPGEETVVPFLESQNIKELYFVIATHADGDHIGGMPAVFNRFQVGIVYENGIVSEQPEYDKMHKVIDAKKIATSIAKQGDFIDIDPSVKFEVLSPPQNFIYEGENNNSIVSQLIYGDVSFLFTADMEYEAENFVLKTYGQKMQSNILKVAHHGSASSSSGGFLKTVSPEIAVISVGAHNRFGHPYHGLLARLEDANANIFRTDEDGNITIRTDGKKFVIECEKNP